MTSTILSIRANPNGKIKLATETCQENFWKIPDFKFTIIGEDTSKLLSCLVSMIANLSKITKNIRGHRGFRVIKTGETIRKKGMISTSSVYTLAVFVIISDYEGDFFEDSLFLDLPEIKRIFST